MNETAVEILMRFSTLDFKVSEVWMEKENYFKSFLNVAPVEMES